MADAVLIDTTFTAKNITAGFSVYELVVPGVGLVYKMRFQVRLVGVVGGGDYVINLRLNDGDVQTDDPMVPKTTYTAAAGVQNFWFPSISIDGMSGDAINIWVLGQAGDNAVTGSIRIFYDDAIGGTTYGSTLETAIFSGITSLANWLRGLARKDAMNATAKTEINTGGGAYDEGTDSQEAQTDQIITIQADLNNPDQYKADISSLPTAIQVDTLLSTNHGAGLWGAATVASKECNYPVTNNDTGLPVSGATVEVSTDIARANVIRKEVTNSLGIATFYLEPGDYYFWTYHDDYTFTNPDLETVPA